MSAGVICLRQSQQISCISEFSPTLFHKWPLRVITLSHTQPWVWAWSRCAIYYFISAADSIFHIQNPHMNTRKKVNHLPRKKSRPTSGQNPLFDQWFSSSLCWTRKRNNVLPQFEIQFKSDDFMLKKITFFPLKITYWIKPKFVNTFFNEHKQHFLDRLITLEQNLAVKPIYKVNYEPWGKLSHVMSQLQYYTP